eukprot:g43520.t1
MAWFGPDGERGPGGAGSVRWVRHLRVTTNYPSLRYAEAAFSASVTPLDGDPVELPALGEARRALEQQGANALACSFLPRAILTSLLVAGRYAHLRGLQILVLPELAEEPYLPRRRYGAERVYECSLAEVTCSFDVVKCSLQQLARRARAREKQDEYGFLLQHCVSLLDFSRVKSLVSDCRGRRVSYQPCRAKALADLFIYQRRCAEQNALANWFLGRWPCAEQGFRACLFTHGNFMLNRVCGCPPPNLAVYGHDLSWPAGHGQPDWRAASVCCYGQGMRQDVPPELSPSERSACLRWIDERRAACGAREREGEGPAAAGLGPRGGPAASRSQSCARVPSPDPPAAFGAPSAGSSQPQRERTKPSSSCHSLATSLRYASTRGQSTAPCASHCNALVSGQPAASWPGSRAPPAAAGGVVSVAVAGVGSSPRAAALRLPYAASFRLPGMHLRQGAQEAHPGRAQALEPGHDPGPGGGERARHPGLGGGPRALPPPKQRQQEEINVVPGAGDRANRSQGARRLRPPRRWLLSGSWRPGSSRRGPAARRAPRCRGTAGRPPPRAGVTRCTPGAMRGARQRQVGPAALLEAPGGQCEERVAVGYARVRQLPQFRERVLQQTPQQLHQGRQARARLAAVALRTVPARDGQCVLPVIGVLQPAQGLCHPDGPPAADTCRGCACVLPRAHNPATCGRGSRKAPGSSTNTRGMVPPLIPLSYPSHTSGGVYSSNSAVIEAIVKQYTGRGKSGLGFPGASLGSGSQRSSNDWRGKIVEKINQCLITNPILSSTTPQDIHRQVTRFWR